MKNNDKKIMAALDNPLLWFGATVVLLLYLYLGTGIHGDDYAHLSISKSWTLWDVLTLYNKTSPAFLVLLPMLYFDYIQFHFFGHVDVWYDVAKIAISFFAIYSAWLFSCQYIEKPRAFLFSLFFVLWPLHDATNYWFVGTYMLITGAWIMLAHVYINQERNVIGTLLGFIGAFWSYASPALVGGLSLTFLATKEYKKFFLFIVPEVIYIIYYFSITKFFDTGDFRTKDISNVPNIVKQLVIQISSFADSALGPSFWLKFYYSFLSSTWISFVVASLLALSCLQLYSKSRPLFSKPLLIAFIGVTLCGFLVFSMTGKFPQIAFNMGDRVTYYGSMLLAFLVVSVPWKKSITIVILFVLPMCITGLSEHWKNWNQHQHKVLENVSTNSKLRYFHPGGTLWVSGNQYSKLGSISHIEFFSESGTARDIFSFALNKKINYRIISLNRRLHWENGVISDIKYGNTFPVGNEITVYDSENNKLVKIPAAEINTYIDSLPPEHRHWIQLISQGWIKNLIIYLMPRLEYVFHS